MAATGGAEEGREIARRIVDRVVERADERAEARRVRAEARVERSRARARIVEVLRQVATIGAEVRVDMLHPEECAELSKAFEVLARPVSS
jgi:hypothetical protein